MTRQEYENRKTFCVMHIVLDNSEVLLIYTYIELLWDM
jgi:hypothetical protein